MTGSRKRIPRGDAVISLAFTLFGLIVYTGSLGIRINMGEQGQAINSAYFPKLLAFFMVAFSGANIIRSIRSSIRLPDSPAQDHAAPPGADGSTTRLSERPAFGILMTVGLAFAYFLLFNILPFLLSSVLFMGSFLFIFRRGKPVSNIAVSLLFSLAVWAMFTFGFEVMLPSGIFDISSATGN